MLRKKRNVAVDVDGYLKLETELKGWHLALMTGGVFWLVVGTLGGVLIGMFAGGLFQGFDWGCRGVGRRIAGILWGLE